MKLIEFLFLGMIFLTIAWLYVGKERGKWKLFCENIEKVSEKKIAWLIFLLALLPQVIVIFMKKIPMSADEVYTISNAAFFAGYDVSSYMSQKMFYNFGYTIFMTPLYKIFHDPVVIYRLMLAINGIIHAWMTVIAYYILHRKLQTSKIVSCAIVLVSNCNAIGLFFDGFIYSELPLSMVVWLCLLLLLELVDATGKKRMILSGLAGLVLAYSYILHSRCLILFVTMGLVVFLYLIIYKKWIVQPISFAVVFAVCMLAEQKLLQYVQTNLYLQKAGAQMKNSVSYVAGNTGRNAITGWESIKRVILHFMSLAGAMTIQTAGILTIVTVIILYYVVRHFKKLRKGEENPSLFLMTAFSLISLWGMVACISLLGSNKWFFLVYVRYFAPFLGPFLMSGLYLMRTDKELKFKWVFIWTGVLTFLVGLVYVFYTYPQLKGNNITKRTTSYMFLAFTRYEQHRKFSRNVIGIALILLIIFTCLILFLYKRRQMITICAIVLLFSICLYQRVQEKQCIPSSQKRYSMADATYELLESGLLEGKQLYCFGSGVYEKAVFNMNYDDNIEFRRSEFKSDKDAVLFSNSLEKLKQYKAAYIYQLDNNEWIGVWNEKISEMLDNTYDLYKMME